MVDKLPLMYHEDMKEIPLTQGKVALVSDEDYSTLSQYKWQYTGTGYASRSERFGPVDKTEVGWKRYKYKGFLMHREILEPPSGMQVDHINGNKLDNRRSNLRLCTRSQNYWNKGKQSNNKSGYKGVFWAKHVQRWRARVMSNGRITELGYFDSPEEAHRSYVKAAKQVHGEFAHN